jgi:hypothetical protein
MRALQARSLTNFLLPVGCLSGTSPRKLAAVLTPTATARARHHTRRPQTSRSHTSPHRAQSPFAPLDAQARYAALPQRPGRALHQQSGRTRWPHDEGQTENLRRFSLRRFGSRFRRHPLIHIDRKKAGLGHYPSPDPRPKMPASLPAARVTCQFAPGQLRKLFIGATFAAMENHRTDSIPNDSYPVKSDRLLERRMEGTTMNFEARHAGPRPHPAESSAVQYRFGPLGYSQST